MDSFLFDLLQGAGIAAAIGIRPFLPVLLVGALAAANLGIDFDGTDFAFLEQAPALAIVLVMLALATFAVRRSGPDAPERPPYVWIFAVVAVVLGALQGAASLADHGHPVVAGVLVGAACAALGFVDDPRPADAHPPPPRRRDRRHAPGLRRGRRARRRRRVRAVPAAGAPRDRRAHRPAGRRAPPLRREVRRAAHPPMSGGPKKLVLTVIDAMKPAMLDRAIADRARAGAEAADRARVLRRRLRRGLSRRSRRCARPASPPGSGPTSTRSRR